MMKRTILPLLSLSLLLSAGCSHHADLTRASSQENFGVEAAKMNLWREALFRFQRAVAMNPADAMARNNLAVAYEAIGDSEKARVTYIEALRLDKSNEYIQKNYSRYIEFLSRNKKRQRGAAPVPAPRNGAASPAVPPLTPAAGTPASTPPAAAPGPVSPAPAAAPAPAPPVVPRSEGGH